MHYVVAHSCNDSAIHQLFLLLLPGFETSAGLDTHSGISHSNFQ